MRRFFTNRVTRKVSGEESKAHNAGVEPFSFLFWQYLKNEDLHDPPDNSENLWVKFLESCPHVKGVVPLLWTFLRKIQLQTEGWRDVEGITDQSCVYVERFWLSESPLLYPVCRTKSLIQLHRQLHMDISAVLHKCAVSILFEFEIGESHTLCWDMIVKFCCKISEDTRLVRPKISSAHSSLQTDMGKSIKIVSTGRKICFLF